LHFHGLGARTNDSLVTGAPDDSIPFRPLHAHFGENYSQFGVVPAGGGRYDPSVPKEMRAQRVLYI
jgi:hypothetical protein